MQVIIAYLLVVLIWSSTPLAIQWSNSSVPFIAAVALRMVLAALVCLVVLTLLRQPLIKQRSDWKSFSVSAIGLFPNMLVVYWSSQFIPSGLMAVVLGATPFFVGLFSWVLFKEKVLTWGRLLALVVAVAGLLLIHNEQLALGGNAVYGILGMLCSSVMFALSSVWLKSLGGGVEPFRQGTGALVLAAPCFALVWLIADGELPSELDVKSISGISYLVLAGSVLGNTVFFYVLRHCTVDKVALVTLITPVIALTLGQLVQDESITWASGLGAGLIITALAIYQGVGRRLFVRVTAGRRAIEHRTGNAVPQAKSGVIGVEGVNAAPKSVELARGEPAYRHR